MKRTRFGFALAIFAGVMAGIFFDPLLGRWSILIGVAVGSAADVALRLREQRRVQREAAARGTQRLP